MNIYSPENVKNIVSIHVYKSKKREIRYIRIDYVYYLNKFNEHNIITTLVRCASLYLLIFVQKKIIFVPQITQYL